MKEYIKIRPRSKSKVIWTVLLSTIVLVCIYMGIFEMHSYSTNARGSFLLTTSIQCFAVLQFIWIETYRWWARYLLFIFSIIAIHLSALGVLQLQKTYYAQQFKDNGTVVKGKVMIASTRESSLWNKPDMVVQYRLNDTNFLKKLDNEEQKFKSGDELNLRVSTQHPYIVEIIQ